MRLESTCPQGSQVLNFGDSPRSIRPIRKRAWHRALNAGKLWIIVPYKWADLVVFKLGFSDQFHTFAKVIPDMNVRDDSAFITWPMEWVCATVQLEIK